MTKPTHIAAAMVLAMATPGIAQNQTSAPDRNILAWPMPDTVSAEGKAMTAAMAAAPMPNPLPPVALQRQMIGGMQDAMGVQLLKKHGVRMEASMIAGVPIRIFYPNGVTSLGRGPVLLNLHGGGFTLDSGSQTESIPIAALTGLPVVSVLYRLAPEHPFPAALDDAMAVYGSLEKDHGAAKIAVYGSSAGAVLSSELVAKLVSQKRPMPAALGFFSGSADLSKSGDSESWMPMPTGGKTLLEAVSGYVGTTKPTDPILSPMHGDLSRFPPTLLVSSTRDALLSGTSIFGRALVEQGVDARLVVFDGLPHAFWAYMNIPETGQANLLFANFLKGKLQAAK